MWNKEQLEAINTINGNVMAVASAGTGKSSCLVARIENMVKQGIEQEDILAISFTNAAVAELKDKLKSIGLEQVNVGTFHSICRKLLLDNGITAAANLPNRYMVKREMEKATGEKNLNIDDVLSFIGYQKAYMIGFAEEFEKKESMYDEGTLRTCYRVYEQIKEQKDWMDFDDYLVRTYFMYKKGILNKNWKYLLVDETQDTAIVQYELIKLWCPYNNVFAVGDVKQCWEENCEVNLQNGKVKKVGDLQIGDLVECNRGGFVKYKPVTNKTRHISENIIKVTTRQGYSITTTTDHKFFVQDPVFKDGITYLYLMYRYGYGFRIGLTSGGKTKKLHNRIVAEHADKLWLLRQFNNNNAEAYYQEEYYSLKYRIPKIPYHNYGRGMGMGQEKMDMIFDEYGNNGIQLLNDFGMDFNYPNYVCKNNKKMCPTIRLYHYAEHNRSVSYCAEFEYKGERIRKSSSDFKTCYMKALELLETTEADSICERLSMPHINNTPYRVVCGSNVMIGMEIPVVVNGEFCSDVIVDIEHINTPTVVYDVEVSASGTMVANNILTHNCLYSWRGAKPELFQNFYKEFPNTKVINLYTNYRSCKNIVDAANVFIAPYNLSDPNYKDSESFNKEDGVIICNDFEDNQSEAIAVGKRIKKLIDEGESPEDIAIIYRNNAMADCVESELRQRDIPYHIMSDKSFFDKKEIRGITALLRLVVNSNDDEAFEICMSEFRCYPLMYYKKELLDELKTRSGMRDCSLYEAFLDYNFDQAWQGRNRDIFDDMITRLKLQHERHLPTNMVINNIIRMFKIEEGIRDQYESDVWQDKFDSLSNLKTIADGTQIEGFLNLAAAKPKSKKKKDGVVLCSIHKSKGLQWKYVFLIGLEDGKFPSDRSTLDEESRIMYVGVTRATSYQWVSSIGNSQFYKEYCKQ